MFPTSLNEIGSIRERPGRVRKTRRAHGSDFAPPGNRFKRAEEGLHSSDLRVDDVSMPF